MTYDYWNDNFGCEGPACDDSEPLRAKLRVTDTTNEFSSADRIIRVYHGLTDEGTNANDFDDKWIFWHEAEHEKVNYCLGGTPTGYLAKGIEEGHARVAERAIAFDALGKPLPPKPDGGWGIYPTSSPNWDLFRYLTPYTERANPASNWFLMMAALQEYRGVFVDNTYDPVDPFRWFFATRAPPPAAFDMV